jgi:gamma-glutamyltranspeptidase / glutathione hydrolase
MKTSVLIAAAGTLLACVDALAGGPAEVTAARGMVVTTTGTGAAAAGIEALQKGGTAMDAAMTAAMMQPCLAAGSYVSYAGIINVVYFEAASGRVFNLNASFNTVLGETEPLTIPGIDPAALAADGLNAFKSAPSGRTALVPGFLAGVEAAQRRFGKRPFADVVAPAIRCAEEGVVLSPELAGIMKSREAVLSRRADTRAIFTRQDGRFYAAGDLFRQPALAATLRELARHGATPYIYRGDWGRRFVDTLRSEGGRMADADLLAYLPTWIEPAHARFNGFDVYAHGLPALGGVSLIESLNLSSAANLAALPPYAESPLKFFWQTQFSKVGAILGAPGVAPQFEKILGFELSPQARLEPETAARLWKSLEAGHMPSVPVPRLQSPNHSDAVVAVDARGNVAAVVHSINTVNWGSTGIFVGGISIPDSASFQQAAIAAVPPGSRLPDSTSPGIVLRKGKPVLGFSGIGSGLAQRTLGALLDILAHGKTPQQAIASPAHGGFDYSKAASGDIAALVGAREFSADFLGRLTDIGQNTREDDAQRGYWIGIAVGDVAPRLRGGELREMKMGGDAVGY